MIDLQPSELPCWGLLKFVLFYQGVSVYQSMENQQIISFFLLWLALDATISHYQLGKWVNMPSGLKLK